MIDNSGKSAYGLAKPAGSFAMRFYAAARVKKADFFL